MDSEIKMWEKKMWSQLKKKQKQKINQKMEWILSQ